MTDIIQSSMYSSKSGNAYKYALSKYFKPSIDEYDDTSRCDFSGLDNTTYNENVIREGGIYEVILEWWIGEVKEINNESFIAILRDLNGNKSIVEFYREVLREEDWKLLTTGTEFAFYVSRVDRPDGRRYIEKLEISSPYVWKEGDEERAIAFLNEVIPDEVISRVFEE